jgi:hypothetical protein
MLPSPFFITTLIAFIWALFAFLTDSTTPFFLALHRFFFFPYWATTLIFTIVFSIYTCVRLIKSGGTQREVPHHLRGLVPTQIFTFGGIPTSPAPPYNNFSTASPFITQADLDNVERNR